MNESTNNENPKRFGNIIHYLVPLYIGFFSLTCVIRLAIAVRDQRNFSGTLQPIILLLYGVALLFILLSVIPFSMFFYRVWKWIIEESSRHGLVPSIATPGRALGFLFIPFFNLYWSFIAFGKLAVDANALAKAKASPRTVSRRIGGAIPVLLCIDGFVIPLLMLAVNDFLTETNLFLSLPYFFSFLTGIVLIPLFLNQAMRLCQFAGKETPETTQAREATFASIFDHRSFGINLYVMAAFFMALVASPFIYIVRMLFDGDLNVTTAFFNSQVVPSTMLKFAVFLLLFYFIRKVWLSSVLYGMAVVPFVFFSYWLFSLTQKAWLINITLDSGVWSFLSGFFTVFALFAAIRQAGLNAWIFMLWSGLTGAVLFALRMGIAYQFYKDFHIRLDSILMTFLQNMLSDAVFALFIYLGIVWHLKREGYKVSGRSIEPLK